MFLTLNITMFHQEYAHSEQLFTLKFYSLIRFIQIYVYPILAEILHN